MAVPQKMHVHLVIVISLSIRVTRNSLIMPKNRFDPTSVHILLYICYFNIISFQKFIGFF